MNEPDKLIAAKKHVRASLESLKPWVFDRRKGSPAELSDQEYWLTRSTPRRKKLSAADQKNYLDAALAGDDNASCVLLDEIIDCLHFAGRLKELSGTLREYAVLALQRNKIAILKKRGRKVAKRITPVIG